MDLFQYLKPLNLFADLSSQALICCHEKCKRAIAVGRGRPTSHLAGHGIPLSERAELTKLLNAIDLENPDNLIPLEDGSLAIPQLRLYNGYICRKCNTRTIDLQLIKKHNPLYGKGSCPEQGIDPNTPSDSHIEYVYLQTWAPIHNRRYWIVEHNGTTIRPAGGQPAQDHTESVQKREIERSRKFGDSNNHMLCFAEQSPWLERTGWEGMLRGRDREVLSAMIEVPRQQGGQPHVLLRRDPDCQEDDVISTSEDEQKIAAILNLVNPMMDRCEQTARSTSRNILCWVRSVKPLSPSPEPFQLLRQPDSTRKYRYLHRRLLAFVLRAYRLDPDVRRRLTKIHMSAKILRLLDSLWQNQYWDSDGQQTSCAIPSTIVNCDSINLDLDEEVSKIDYMNDRGNNENDDENVYENNRGDNENDDESDDESGDEDDDDENDDENDDRSNLESERDSNDNYDESQFAGSGHIEVDSNITADAQSDSACFPAFHTTNAQRCVDEALELLFGLSVALFEERPINERRDSMLAVLFSGILGFSKTRQSFLQARDFTTHLSALIYNQRLVLLERALPVRPYPKLGIECRPRRNQLQQLNKPSKLRSRGSSVRQPFILTALERRRPVSMVEGFIAIVYVPI
ncbi:hypothetical protein TGAMA5MH_03785 [Trichoderma gamsii]|uniref:Uncharacterized protein n=1 Tax=Trichoderma gamsii TaxID=398673 RepID=A0A2K0TG33_9HYPO|nr:hypothetical protein TGAMA5MH_03785 [Trichoderma gamsii]